MVVKKKNITKKALGGINKTVIIVALLFILPASFFAYQNYSFKKQQQQDILNKKKLNQEAYDSCLKMAYLDYRVKERNMCWVYNHDAIGCDLEYMLSYKIVDELPEDKMKSDIKECDKKYPPDERLYSKASPDAIIVPYGKLEEREAFKKVMQTSEYKSFTTYPIEEGYKITYEVTVPTKDNPHWMFRLYKYSNTDENTVATFKIDAISGELSKI